MGVLSHVPGGLDTNPLDFEAAGATRDSANALDGTERLLLHGRCMPTLAGELDGMDAQAARFRSAAFKTYTQFGPPDGPAGFFLDDERHGTPFIERRAQLGVRNIAVHKGLAFGQRGYEFSTCARHRPGGQAPSRHDLPRSTTRASTPRVKEGPYDPNAQAPASTCWSARCSEAGKPRQRLRRARQHLALRDARPGAGGAPARQAAEDLRRGPRPLGHRLDLVRQPAGPDPGVPRLPDQPASSRRSTATRR